MTYTLLLDQDGVLADYDEYAWKMIIQCGYELDINHPTKQINRYITDHVVKQHKKMAHTLNKQPGWFRSLPVVHGAQEGVDRLLTAGVNLWVCTKPLEKNPTCRDEKGAWLAEHFPQLLHKLIITPDKSMIRGDILLDDAPKSEWLSKAEWKPVVFTRPFNGAGSEWQDLPHWTWGDDIDILHPDSIATLQHIANRLYHLGGK